MLLYLPICRRQGHRIMSYHWGRRGWATNGGPEVEVGKRLMIQLIWPNSLCHCLWEIQGSWHMPLAGRSEQKNPSLENEALQLRKIIQPWIGESFPFPSNFFFFFKFSDLMCCCSALHIWLNYSHCIMPYQMWHVAMECEQRIKRRWHHRAATCFWVTSVC